jgi:hypothetical protein
VTPVKFGRSHSATVQMATLNGWHRLWVVVAVLWGVVVAVGIYVVWPVAPKKYEVKYAVPLDRATFDAVSRRVIDTAPDGLSREQLDAMLDSELVKAIVRPRKNQTSVEDPPLIQPEVVILAPDGAEHVFPAALPRSGPTVH